MAPPIYTPFAAEPMPPLPAPAPEPAPAPAPEPAPAATPAMEAAATAVPAAAAQPSTPLAPTAPPVSAPVYPPAAPYPPAPAYAPVPPMAAPRSNSGVAIVLEVIAGLFGFFGIGWLISGYTTTGLLLLVGGIIWDVVGGLLSVTTLGFGFLCMGVVNIIVVVVSAIALNNRVNRAR